ncbi:MAG: zf-HC2 domain-containing protein [Lachnospiraceae bacterium]|nr:zf-HC2 domain-containing protein [Lachnospiraceae bacterium]
MKKECSIVRDLLPLYFENMLSEDTAAFVKEHLENCSDCNAEFECLKSGKQIDKAETTQRGNDANVITAVKKKIVKRIFKMVAAVCLVFIVLLSTIMLYMSISYPVTKDNISLSIKTDGGYTYIVLETEVGKSLYFNSKTEDILNDQNKVCGQRITLYNLQYHNNFSQNTGSISWGRALNDEKQYLEVIVELENDTLQISNAE